MKRTVEGFGYAHQGPRTGFAVEPNATAVTAAVSAGGVYAARVVRGQDLVRGSEVVVDDRDLDGAAACTCRDEDGHGGPTKKLSDIAEAHGESMRARRPLDHVRKLTPAWIARRR